jgi:UDP-2,3-diacylglucosamine pyrophosphatase LpxH
MSAKRCSDDEFVRLFSRHGATEVARVLKMTERNVYKRRRNLEHLFGDVSAPTRVAVQYSGRLPLDLKNGTILVGSDFHIWPGEASTCLRAFKKFIKDIQPEVVILNGDVMDFPRISRHPQNWETAPDPQQEIEAAQDHLNDLVQACKLGARKIWTIGNHDIRFESSIANQLPQFRGVKGVHLSDHFPVWEKAMSCMVNYGVNGGTTIIKHRPVSSGETATKISVKKGGIHFVHGHLHRQSVQPYSDYLEYDRYGVDTGCIADKSHKAFGYTEDSPLDWRSGFGLLTYRDARLMPPELITKHSDNEVWFRGSISKV